jgi:hypothetical protein
MIVKTDAIFERDLIDVCHFPPSRSMAFVELVHPDVTHRIPVDLLVVKCTRFIANQELARAPYRVQSAVAADSFLAFVAVLEGKAADITEGNYAELSQLCEEFGFAGLTAAMRDSELRRRLSVLEERCQQSDWCRQTRTQEQAMIALEAEVAQLKEASVGWLHRRRESTSRILRVSLNCALQL